MKLDILIITYNRSTLLKRTLDVFSKSIFASYPLTVINNCSTDDTVDVAAGFKAIIPGLRVISNRVNIGGDANILRAIEMSEGEYTWVVCDDDELDLSHVGDFMKVIEDSSADFIHVGAHRYNWNRFAGRLDTPRNLVAQGYPYFKFASFVPCTIFKTEVFRAQFLLAAYRNIVNSYPHMPCFLNGYEEDKLIYIAQKQIVRATEGSLNYSPEHLHYWWLNTCKLLNNKQDVRLAFLDQFRNINGDGRGYDHALIMLKILVVKERPGGQARRFLKEYFTLADKAFIQKRMFSDWIYFNITNPLRALKRSLNNTAGNIAQANKSNIL